MVGGHLGKKYKSPSSFEKTQDDQLVNFFYLALLVVRSSTASCLIISLKVLISVGLLLVIFLMLVFSPHRNCCEHAHWLEKQPHTLEKISTFDLVYEDMWKVNRGEIFWGDFLQFVIMTTITENISLKLVIYNNLTILSFWSILQALYMLSQIINFKDESVKKNFYFSSNLCQRYIHDVNKLPCKFGDGHSDSFWAMSNYMACPFENALFAHGNTLSMLYSETRVLIFLLGRRGIPTWEFWSYETSVVMVLFLLILPIFEWTCSRKSWKASNYIPFPFINYAEAQIQ